MKTVSRKHRFYESVVTGLFFLLIYSLPQTGITAGIDNTSENTTQVQLVSIEAVGRIIVNIDGWPDPVGKAMPVQMKIPHVPYVEGQCPDETAAAQQAISLTEKLLQNVSTLQIQNIERGSEFYLLADVIADGVNVGQQISASLAAAQKSGDEEWCKPALRASGKFRINRN